MDPWATLTPVFTVLATGLVTFGSVWVKGRYDLKAERMRIEAAREDAKDALAAEEAKEARRVERESAELERKAQAKEAERERGEEASAQAEARYGADSAFNQIAQVLDELSNESDTTDAGLMDRIWNEKYDSKFRKAIEVLADPDARDALILIADALSDFQSYVSRNDLTSFAGWHAKSLLRVALQVAGTTARGDERSPTLADKLSDIEGRVERMNSPWSSDTHF